jgi:NAD(P)-dependent dehydrogenase (short-subunit alcohol dehydrogenase family)
VETTAADRFPDRLRTSGYAASSRPLLLPTIRKIVAECPALGQLWEGGEWQLWESKRLQTCPLLSATNETRTRSPDSAPSIADGQRDTAFNDAGIAAYKPIEDMTTDDVDRVLATNVKSSLFFCASANRQRPDML